MLFIFSREKRLVRIILLALIIAFILIAISFYLIMVKKEKKNNVVLSKDLFNVTSYYCEYNMNVFSNKNQNLYKINETYLCNEGDYIRMDIVGDISKFSYIVTPNCIGIKSEEQISSLILENYNNEKLNLQSISTFFFLRNHITDEKTESCSLSETVQDDNIIYKITIDNSCDKCKEMLGENLNITSFELVVDKKTNLPLEYIVYTNDDKVYLDINYEKFEINSNFDMKVFDF